jgi:hypothetical protein
VPFQRSQHRVKAQQGLALLRPIANERKVSNEVAIVFFGTSAGEQETADLGVSLLDGDGPKIIQPVENLAADPFMVGVVPRVIK